MNETELLEKFYQDINVQAPFVAWDYVPQDTFDSVDAVVAVLYYDGVNLGGLAYGYDMAQSSLEHFEFTYHETTDVHRLIDTNFPLEGRFSDTFEYLNKEGWMGRIILKCPNHNAIQKLFDERLLREEPTW